MSEDNFIARWSRLKRQTAKPQGPKGGEPAAAPEAEGTPDTIEAAQEKRDTEGKTAPEPEFDLSSLPSIEEITAGTDIRAFLQSGVPAELTKAALRKAWTADPAIRDFIGLAENQWDFTDPSSIPGFGPLGPADDVRRLVAGAMGRLDDLAAAAKEPIAGSASQHPEGGSGTGSFQAEASRQAAAAQEEKQQSLASHTQVEEQEDAASAASHSVDESPEPQTIRKSRNHGGALPQ
jgi:hypothetical protein